MNTPDSYQPIVILVSICLIFIFAFHLYISVREYHKYRDDRAARALLIALVLFMGTFGALISSLGFYQERDSEWSFPIIGLSILRGVFLVGGFTLILMDWKSEHRDKKELS